MAVGQQMLRTVITKVKKKILLNDKRQNKVSIFVRKKETKSEDKRKRRGKKK